MSFSPALATGIIYRVQESGERTFTGSCFMFRRDDVLLTAKHCVHADGSYVVELSGVRRNLNVKEIRTHPTADLAVLIAEGSFDHRAGDGGPETAFQDGVGDWNVGDDFMTFGYPSEGPGADTAVSPTPRMFKGHFQRFLQYESPAGSSYLAGEMSIPAPGGLSGSALFNPAMPSLVTGLVTTNLETFAVTDSVSEVLQDGTHYREESRRVLNYGLALMLSDVADWLYLEVPESAQGWLMRSPVTGGALGDGED
ncbi:S1 family peptidase [Arthrobacter sp. MDT2-2]